MSLEQYQAPRTAALFQRVQLSIQNDASPKIVFSLMAELIRTAADEMEIPEETVREQLISLIRRHGEKQAAAV